MRRLRIFLVLFAALLVLPTVAQQLPPLPRDAAVRYGVLPNGLTYYVRHNALPEERVNFYIAQKVGAVQEEENQRGLAHFLEHMCFNGTNHFPGNGIVKFCERIGVKFGVDLNAYTSTDETVYRISNVPVKETNIDSCLLILSDWADGLILAPEEIDKERGVIHEEWRMTSSATMRMYERQLPVLYPNSRYGNRLPIGLMSVVDNFKYQELRDYYEKWYRPDLQGIVVVGDIDVDAMEQQIKKIFSGIKMPENAAKYEHYPVPATAHAIYAVDKDKEMARPSINLIFKQDALPAEMACTQIKPFTDFINDVVVHAVNSRLDEYSKKADCPYLTAGVFYGNYLVSKTADAFYLVVTPKEGQDVEAVKCALSEVLRAAKFGITPTEIKRSKAEVLSAEEKVFDNRDKQEHDFHAQRCIRNFLENHAMPSLEMDHQICQVVAQQVPDEMYSRVIKEYTASTDSNFVCVAFYPDKEGATVPTADELRAAVQGAVNSELTAYVDNVKSEPLISKLPKPVKIKSEASSDFGYKCWTLSNGARVFFKNTDFNDSQVLFVAKSKGGLSRTDVKDNVSARLVGNAEAATGLGKFTSTDLEKMLAGKQAALSVDLGETTETLQGYSTPKDLRTLFELINLHFGPLADNREGYDNMMARLRTSLEQNAKDPMGVFVDSLRSTLNSYKPAIQLVNLQNIGQADYNTIRRIYSERFASAGDFDFYFTGAFNEDSLRLFTEQYIAPLKGVKKRETYVERDVLPVKGIVDNHFRRNMETPQAITVSVWTGETSYSLKEDVVMNTLASVLTQRYIKNIREDAGLAYSVSANGQFSPGSHDTYILQVVCPFKPEARDRVLELIYKELEDIAKNGVTVDELDQVKKYELKQFADNQKKNEFWQNLIETKISWGQDCNKDLESIINGMTSDDVRNFVRKTILDKKNRVTVSMVPTDMSEK